MERSSSRETDHLDRESLMYLIWQKILENHTNNPPQLKPQNFQDWARANMHTLAEREEFQQLNQRQQTVLKMHFGIGYERAYTIKEIADSLGMKKQMVGRVQAKAIHRLKKCLGK